MADARYTKQMDLFSPEEMQEMIPKRQPAQPIPPVSPIPTPLLSWQKPISQTDPNVNPYHPTRLTNEVKALLNL